MINYILTRSKRKTVALHIRDGTVEIRAPLKTPKRDIDKFISSKEKWIVDKLALSNERMKQRESFSLDYGDTVLYRGKQYPIMAKDGGRRDLTEKALGFAKQMSAIPAAIKINGAKTRWGSCSGKKSLNFSWRLIMAEDDVIDYVVVHELAHITEMNHSPRFWSVVESVLPDYRERRIKLKALQRRLSCEDWE
jgi:hypothetical protein